MNNEEISRKLIRGLSDGQVIGVLWSGGKSSSVLWDIVHSELDDYDTIFVDHGKHPIETHNLMHKMFRAGNFKPKIWMNRDKLSRVEIDQETGIGMIEGRKYDMRDAIVRKWLYDDVLTEHISYNYDVILAGDRMARRDENQYLNFIEFGYPSHLNGAQTVIARPLLNWSEHEVWQYLSDKGITVNERYGMGWRVVDYSDDIKSGDKPAWEYPEEYNEESDRIDALIRDNPIS
jgi:3'-phosphoadenosine 5'-phosphosulfate sulfotransferase (PAPS reductase)/FAD synthetase